MRRLADDTFESDAPGHFLISPFHDHSKIVELVGQFDWDTVFFCITRFAPIKGSTEKGAAGTAFETGVGIFHKDFFILSGRLMKSWKKRHEYARKNKKPQEEKAGGATIFRKADNTSLVVGPALPSAQAGEKSVEIIVIAAMAANRVIGRDGRIPWHLPADLHHFKQTTMGHPLIMGRKTYESIGGALPGRRTVVVSREQAGPAIGCETVQSLEEALRLLANEEKVFIAGGGEVYRQAMPLADRLVLTVIDRSYAGDTFFPELPVERFFLQEERKLAGSPDCTIKIFERCAARANGAAEGAFKVKVECYCGYRGEETPRRFLLGSRNVEVRQVLDRWLAPDHRYFKLIGEDGATYILRHDVEHDGWQVTLFSQRTDNFLPS